MPVAADSVTPVPASPGALGPDSLISEAKPGRRWPWVVGGVVGIGLFFMMLVPEMCGSRPILNRTKSAANLRMIGMGLTSYAQANGHQLPSTFAELVLLSDLSPDVFISPASGDTERAAGPTPEVWGKQLIDPAGHHCSYRYVAGGLMLNQLGPDDLLAYEPIQNEDKDGMNLLYADGRVDWVQANERSAARKRYDRLLADDAAGVRPLRWQD